MKTAEKILLTSLEMFNEQGETNVTCVDIAIELDISPGNLYYHFKGKEVIVNALFDMYLARTSKILVSPDSENINIPEFFHYILQLLESASLFQFIYRNPTDLIHKYPAISRSFMRLIKSKEEAFLAILQHFQEMGVLVANPQQLSSLAQIINLVFTQSQNYFLLKGNNVEGEDMSFHSLCWIFHTLAPYLNMPDDEKETILSAITEQTI